MKKENFSQMFTIVCYAVSLGVQLTGSFVMSSVGAESLGVGYTYLAYLLPQIGYILCFTVFALVLRIPLGRVFSLENVKPFSYVYVLLCGLGLFFIALLPNVLLQMLFQKTGSSSTVVLPPMETAGEITLAILFICVLPAIGEELMFRKAFCEGMKGNNEYVIVLLGGLFFSLTHYNLVQTVHQFVLGCVLCFLYLRTRNITVTMLIHFLNNLLALFIERWTEGFIAWNSFTTLGIAFAIGAVLLGGGLFLAAKKTTAQKGGDSKVETCTVVALIVVAVVWTASALVSYIN